MSTDAALAQLLDTGIPRARARAALTRSKGDAQVALERVFNGDFDDIPSDDEEDTEPAVNASGLQTPGDSPAPPLRPESVTIEGPKGDAMAVEEDDEDGSMDELSELEGEQHEGIDPYANVFFSRDRIETVTETMETPEQIAVDVGGVRTSVPVLTRSEWMSGCPEGNEQSLLFQLYQTIDEPTVACASEGCTSTFERRKSDFLALLPTWESYTDRLAALINPSCSRCGHRTCRACGELVKPSKHQKSAESSRKENGKQVDSGQNNSPRDDALLHCVNIQGIIVGVGLHMIEKSFHANTKARTLAATANEKQLAYYQSKAKKPIAKGGQDFYNDDDDDDDHHDTYNGNRGAKGVGYAGNVTEDTRGQVAAAAAQEKVDQRSTELLRQIRPFLPNSLRDGGARMSDIYVHATSITHLRRRSGFVNDLLRTDSLTDMSNRLELYEALLDWLETVSQHESLASMLAMPQMRQIRSEPVQREKDQLQVTYEGGPSPRELLESCVIQAQAALKGLNATEVDDEQVEKDAQELEEANRLSLAEYKKREMIRAAARKVDESYKLRVFCKRILDSAQRIDKSLIETKGKAFVDRMRESLPRAPGAAALNDIGMADNNEEDKVVAYERWARAARFDYCDMSIPSAAGAGPSTIKYRHAYSTDVEMIANLQAPKRSIAIAKELATLTTNLPVNWHSTIFVRTDENRVDCLKAMIIGPEGTPYQNGCFIFDIFLPADYNQAPAKAKSMTTNGGLYRYNPNLYAEGKVCLSLLGSWSGPSWIPGKSTLLQVLVSTQSLILCEEPYLNEPGWANSGGSPASKRYSANVRRMVLDDAMANNIASPPFPFEQEIRTHFRLKAASIREQIVAWRKLDDGLGIDGANMGGGGLALDETGGVGGKRKTTGSGASAQDKTAFEKAADKVLTLLAELEGDKAREHSGSASPVKKRGKKGTR